MSLLHKPFCRSGIGIRDGESADPTMPAHRHSFFQVVFVAGGHAVHEIGDQVFQATAGSIFFVPPEVVHRLRYTRETECYLLYFDAAFLRQGQVLLEAVNEQSLLNQLPELAPFVYQSRCAYQLDPGEVEQMRARCKAIAKACASRTVYDAIDARAELALLLSLVGRKYLPQFRRLDQEGAEAASHDSRARKAIAFMKKNFRSNPGLEDVAREVNLSGDYLTLLLKRETGQSFKQMLDGLRLENSKSMLAYTDAPIKKIAVECGFVNPAHFARRFKSWMAVTPGHFRRRHHEHLAS